jgi:hypothetical protein
MRPGFLHRSFYTYTRTLILGVYLALSLAGCGSDDESAGIGASKSLSWTAVPDPSVEGYKLYWGTTSHVYESNVDVGPNVSHTLSGLRPNTEYFFAVSAYNSGGESALSAEVTSVVESSLVVEDGKFRRPRSGS